MRRPRPWFHYWITRAAHRAILFAVGDDFHGFQSQARNAEIGRSATAVDDGADRGDAGTGVLQNIDHFARATPGSDYVFHYHGRVAGLDGESPAQDHFSGRVALGENEARLQASRLE